MHVPVMFGSRTRHILMHGLLTAGFITKRDFLKVSFSKNLKRTKVSHVWHSVAVPTPTHMSAHVARGRHYGGLALTCGGQT